MSMAFKDNSRELLSITCLYINDEPSVAIPEKSAERSIMAKRSNTDLNSKNIYNAPI
jgi:hypothetical protein